MVVLFAARPHGYPGLVDPIRCWWAALGDTVHSLMLRFRITEALTRRQWIIPLAGVAAGIALSFATVAIDRHARAPLLPKGLTGNATDAQQILSTITSAVVPLTTTVLTVTLVAIQLAMGQFSPRIVRALLDDPRDQLAIAIFGGTFTFCLFSMRGIGTSSGAPVPSVTIATALALCVLSGAALFLFVNHAGRRLRVAALVDLVGDALGEEIDRRYPPVQQPSDPSVVTASESGTVVHIAPQRLVELACRADCALHLVPMMGDFVIRGAPLFRIVGDDGGLDHSQARKLVVLSDERTHSDDPAFGFRKLVDMALRALGTGAHDATTAVEVLNRLHDALRQLAPRPFPPAEHLDDHGEVRLVVRSLDWDGYVRLAFDEIRLASGPYPQATRRLEAALEDLKTVAPPERRPALDRQLRLLQQVVENELTEQEDIKAALIPDAQGIGSGRDVVRNGSALSRT
jgi:uncharacterized membrane protein